MDFVLIAMVALLLWGMSLRRDGSCLSKEQTGAVNGFFVLVVFLRHGAEILTIGPLDRIFGQLNTELDQLLVVSFLFYSGYGMMRSIAAKGAGYVRGIPKNRVLRIWLHFALIVGLYAILGLILQKNYGWKRILMSFTGWDSIGNSNWYIFAMLYFYAATWLGFRLFPRRHILAVGAVTGLSVLYILLLQDVKGLWWYDTALVYPAGMIFGLFQDKILGFLQKKVWLPWVAMVVCGLLFWLCFRLQNLLLCRELMAVAFALTILCLTMVVRIGNPVLDFLGKYTFEIYILQRLPMNALGRWIENGYLLLGLSFALTIPLAMAVHALLKKLDQWLF
ncbi:MAG: acyltransferase family protein [Oscillospiraceae bacterium]|nr:acyltransferase family protein [Oscillospiraceae bacterium]